MHGLKPLQVFGLVGIGDAETQEQQQLQRRQPSGRLERFPPSPRSSRWLGARLRCPAVSPALRLPESPESLLRCRGPGCSAPGAAARLGGCPRISPQGSCAPWGFRNSRVLTHADVSNSFIKAWRYRWSCYLGEMLCSHCKGKKLAVAGWVIFHCFHSNGVTSPAAKILNLRWKCLPSVCRGGEENAPSWVWTGTGAGSVRSRGELLWRGEVWL